MRVDANLESFVAKAVKKAHKYDKPSERNEAFARIKPYRGYTPVKVNTMSAVFLNKGKSGSFIMKRTILRDVSQEEGIARALKHPNIMETTSSKMSYGTESSTEEGHLFLFSEYLDVRITQSYVGKSEELIKDIMRDILEGLKYMHALNIAHLDLKIANIMGQTLEDGEVVYKILDFGFARNLNNIKGRPDSVIIEGKSYGTYPYKSPEVVLENRHGLKSDIWCIGAICYFLALGKTPFFKKGGEKQSKQYREFLKNPEIAMPDGFTQEFEDFIVKCMNKNIDDRPSAAELLNHPFITQEYKYNEFSSTEL